MYSIYRKTFETVRRSGKLERFSFFIPKGALTHHRPVEAAVVSFPAVRRVRSSRNVHWTFLQRGQAIPQAEPPVQQALLTVLHTGSTRNTVGVSWRHGSMPWPAAAEDCLGIRFGYSSLRNAGIYGCPFTPAFSFQKRETENGANTAPKSITKSKPKGR